MSFPALINAIMLAVALVGSTNFVMSPILADIARDMQVATARIVLVPATCATALAVVAPVVGLGMQTVSRVRVIAGGLAVYGIAWVAASQVQRFDWLLACAALAGAAVGAVLPACYAAAAELSDDASRGRVMGRIVGGWAIAFLSVLPFTLLVQRVGWRGGLGLLGLSSMLLAAVLSMLRRPAVVASGERNDLSLVLRSLREVFRDRPTVALLGVNLIDMAGFFGVHAYLGSEIRRVTGWTVATTGQVMAAYGVGLAIVTFNARWLDRAGRQRAAVIALLLTGVVMAVLPWTLAVAWALPLAIGLWGVAQGSAFTAMTALATDQLPHRRAVVTALLSASTYVGVSLFTPAFMAVFDRAGYAVLAAGSGAACLLSGLLLARVRLGGKPAAPASGPA